MDRFYEFLMARICPLPWAQIRIFIENRQKKKKTSQSFFCVQLTALFLYHFAASQVKQYKICTVFVKM